MPLANHGIELLLDLGHIFCLLQLYVLAFSVFLPWNSVVQHERVIFPGKISRLSLTTCPQCIRLAHLREFAMHGFEPKLALHLVNEGQPVNRDRLRPAIVTEQKNGGWHGASLVS